jgi:DNA-binding transcriptional MerR regulator
MEKDRPSYALEDLSTKTGFDIRVIRSFIEQGLLHGPSSLGRYARYSDWHLIRLLAIKALKVKRGLKLSDIRQTLLCMSDSEILALAETAREPELNPQSSALDYIRAINLQTFSSQTDQMVAATEVPAGNQNVETNRSATELSFGSKLGNHQSLTKPLPSGETWYRFQITPDVELSVRGIQTEQQMARMQSIATQLRGFLIGGKNE